jgi:hypothetical protein
MGNGSGGFRTRGLRPEDARPGWMARGAPAPVPELWRQLHLGAARRNVLLRAVSSGVAPRHEQAVDLTEPGRHDSSQCAPALRQRAPESGGHLRPGAVRNPPEQLTDSSCRIPHGDAASRPWSGGGGIRTLGGPKGPQRFSRPPRSTAPAPLRSRHRVLAGQP